MTKSRIAILLVLVVLVASVLSACASSSSTDSSSPASSGSTEASAPTVSNMSLSADKSGSNPTTTFAPTDTIYLTADVSNLAAGTSVDIKWYALNVSGQDPNTPFFTSNVVYSSGSTLTASTSSTSGGFPTGQYKVEVYVGGVKAGEQDFTIQ